LRYIIPVYVRNSGILGPTPFAGYTFETNDSHEWHRAQRKGAAVIPLSATDVD
jgi:hypothetical protein